MRRFGIFALASFTGVLLSRELAFSLPILGVGPDLLIIVLATLAMSEEPRTAAIAGFVLGVFRDMLMASPVGLSAMAFALTAYVVALAGEVRGVWAYLGVIAAATAGSQLLFGLSLVLLGQNADLSPIPRVVALTTAYNALLAPLLMPLLRKITLVQRAGTGLID